jgi:hypothetical protein
MPAAVKACCSSDWLAVLAATLPAAREAVAAAGALEVVVELAPAALPQALTASVAHTASARIRVRTLRNRFMWLTVPTKTWKHL